MRYSEARAHLIEALRLMRQERAYAVAQRGEATHGSADEFDEKTVSALETILVDPNGAPKHFPAALMPCSHLSNADIAEICEMRGVDLTQSANEPCFSVSASQLRSLLVEAQVASDASMHAHIKQHLSRRQQGIVMNAYRRAVGVEVRPPKHLQRSQA